jgi:hypothetical protein
MSVKTIALSNIPSILTHAASWAWMDFGTLAMNFPKSTHHRYYDLIGHRFPFLPESVTNVSRGDWPSVLHQISLLSKV